jgi:hypothetical protein
MAGVVLVPWYATILRGDLLADAVAEIAAPVAFKYGASRSTVLRSRDDMYRISQYVWFDDKDDWYRYWEGPEMIEFRARYAGKYQVPVVYAWHDDYGTVDAPGHAAKAAAEAAEAPDESAVTAG